MGHHRPAVADRLQGGLRRGRAGPRLELHRALLPQPGAENSGYVTDSFLTSIAKGAGVKDLDKWNSDRSDNSKWDPLLSKNDSDAKSLGFAGTPSILVEGPRREEAVHDDPDGLQIEAAVKSVS